MIDQAQGRTMSNLDFVSAGVLQLRLDTTSIIERLTQFLSGVRITPYTLETGETVLKEESTGSPIVNNRGVQQLVNFVQGVINPSVVQGNYDRQQYDNHMFRIHKNLAYIIVCNYMVWAMDKKDRKLVMDFIMNLIEPFLSRLIDNKERDSYGQTMKTVESSRLEQGGFNWNPFSKGGKQ